MNAPTNLRVVPMVRPAPVARAASPALMPPVRTWQAHCATPKQRAGSIVVIAERGLVVIAVEDRRGTRALARKVPDVLSGMAEEVLVIDMLIEQLAAVAPSPDEVIDLFAASPGLRAQLAPACNTGQLVNHPGIPAFMHPLHRLAMEELSRHPLEVATDASRSRRRREAGLGAVAETGEWVTQVVQANNINSAEIAAITMAVQRFAGSRPLSIRSDSRAAVAAVRHALSSGSPNRPHPQETRDLRDLLIAAEGRHVEVEWVRGHAGDALNLAADRLAVLVRRTSEVPAHRDEVARRIVTEELAAQGAQAA